MAHAYVLVGWNRQKRIYDAVLAGGVLAYLAVFVGTGSIVHPEATIETLLIRGFGTAAIVLLHVVLAIGPLARLDARFLPLLYNRRHLGVTTFLLGLAHGAFATVQFHAAGDTDPLVSVLTAEGPSLAPGAFPFQPLGVAALAILFVMAATSHDFWLANLGAPFWKTLHMAVYLAWALLVAHVALGVLQAETSPWLAGSLVAAAATIAGLHLAAGWRERRGDREDRPVSGSFVDCGPVEGIADGRARVVCAGGERVAIYRHGNSLSAISNVCRHQNGPLGEGRIVDGCVTCPWHGWQYRPETGASPPPFEEKVPTYRVKVEGGRVLVDPRPNPPGTFVEPARVEA